MKIDWVLMMALLTCDHCTMATAEPGAIFLTSSWELDVNIMYNSNTTQSGVWSSLPFPLQWSEANVLRVSDCHAFVPIANISQNVGWRACAILAWSALHQETQDALPCIAKRSWRHGRH
jgi:hypothetical protein